MTNEEAYRLYFKKLSRSVEFLKAIIKEFNIQLPPPPKLKRERNKLVRLFKNRRAVSACANCADKCCYQGGSPIYLLDLLYVLLKNPDFVLPEPDYDYLNKNNPDAKDRETTLDGPIRKEWSPQDRQQESYCKVFKYPPWAYRFKCIFGGRNGCRLGPYRPRICLDFVCEKLRRTLGIDPDYCLYDDDDPVSKWVDKLENKLQQIQKRLGQSNQLLKGFSQEEIQEFALADWLYFYGDGPAREISLPEAALPEKEKLRIKAMRSRDPNPGDRSYYDEDLSPNLKELLLLINIKPPN